MAISFLKLSTVNCTLSGCVHDTPMGLDASKACTASFIYKTGLSMIFTTVCFSFQTLHS